MDSKRFLLRCADKLHLPVTTRYRMFIACAKPGECAPQPRKIDQFRSINCANVAADAEKPRDVDTLGPIRMASLRKHA